MTAPPVNLHAAQTSDEQAFAAFFRAMLKHGIYIPPSQYEVNFISAAQSSDDIAKFLHAFESTAKLGVA